LLELVLALAAISALYTLGNVPLSGIGPLNYIFHIVTKTTVSDLILARNEPFPTPKPVTKSDLGNFIESPSNASVINA